MIAFSKSKALCSGKANNLQPTAIKLMYISNYCRINIKYVYQIVKVIIGKISRKGKTVITHAGINLRIQLCSCMTIFMKPVSANKLSTKVPKRCDNACDIFNL